MKRKETCASCGHMNDGICDIHNSKFIYGASEEHGCHYWQIETDKTETRCESCAGFEYTTPSKTWGRCNFGFTKKEIHGNWFTCNLFSNKGDENTLKCKIEICGFNNEGECRFEENDINNKSFRDVASDALQHGCKNKKLKETLKKLDEPQSSTERYISKKCSNEALGKSCPCYGMGLCGAKEFSDGEFEARYSNKDFECEVARAKMRTINEKNEEVSEEVQELEQTETTETAIDAPVSNSVQEFDYSSVDDDTSTFLQEKANRITEIRMKSVIAIGKELKEAQDKLANHDKGTFYEWFESIGLKKDTVYRNINAYEWVIANCDNLDIQNIQNIQPSLLFAVSKPSAPTELQKAVMDGDITTHKQYKDLEAKLKSEQEAARAASQAIEAAVGRMNDAEKEAQKLKTENRNIYEAYQKDIKTLREQLEQARQNSDPEKVKELEKSIETFQQQLDDMTEMLEEKDRQLKEQPIEVTAAKVEEVIPEELKQAVVDNVVSNINKLLHISAHEYRIFIEAGKADSEKYLDIIDDLLFFMQGIRKDIIQKG